MSTNLPEFDFPPQMKAAVRWMVRKRLPGTDNKQPYSPLAKKPAGYVPKKADEGKSAWRWRWNDPSVWASYETAVQYWRSHPDEVEGLSFVLHPGGDDSESLRFICCDFDGAFGPDGKPWPWIQLILALADSFVERSRSGKGLHLFLLIRSKPFTNLTHTKHPEGGAIEVLCSSQVAVTGDEYHV